LVYSTYLGGSDHDQANAIAVDIGGNVYVAGHSLSGNYPTTPGALQTAKAAVTDAFVTKLRPSGGALFYSTYLGGSGGDHANAIAIDASGNAYVAGLTGSSNYPTTPGALGAANGGGNDAFVSKLGAGGDALLYSTYLGGANADLANGIAIDDSGSAHVAGYTRSTNYPTTPEAFRTALTGVEDAFVTKLEPSGGGLLYSTYLGGSGGEEARAIALDAGARAYVAGITSSTNFPTSVGALLATPAGGQDAFVTKLDLFAALAVPANSLPTETGRASRWRGSHGI
jgi:hypothetical protein